MHSEKLPPLRLQLHEQICSLLPDLAGLEMFNRRKSETLSEDSYVLSYSVVNKIKVTRLNKVLKGLSTTTEAEDQVDVADTGDLVETCLSLRQFVLDLTALVKVLRAEISSLQDGMTILEL